MLPRRTLLVAGAAAIATPARAAGLQPIRLGLLHTLSPAPFYIAKERGYFAENGVDLSFVFFEAAQPIAAAAVAGDIDVGITALTGGFFNLAEKGALKVIGGGLHEEKGWQGSAILVSNKAYNSGLTTPAKLGGHSIAITQYGSSFHYMIGRMAEKLGFDETSVVLRPVQQVPNMVAAVQSGQVDATIAIASMAKPLAASGQAHIIGWAGEVVPYQITAIFTTPRTIAAHPEALKGFMRAYAKGVNDYRAAFLRIGVDGHPITDAATDAAIPLITKYVFTGDPKAREKILAGVGYYPLDGTLDTEDVLDQLAWFKARGLVKGNADPNSIIDTKFQAKL